MLDMNDDATIRLDPDNILNSNESTCRSCTIDEYNANYLDNYDINTFSLLNQNIQSFNAKKSKLEAFLNAIKHDFLNNKYFNDTYYIIGICRPPRGNKLEFIHSLENILSNDSLSNQKMIIAGDMNLNISDTNDNYVYRYLSMLTSFNFFSAITKPTHFF